MNANHVNAAHKKAVRRPAAARRRLANRADVAAFEEWQRQARDVRISRPRR